MKDTSGQTMVESAVAATILLLFVFGSFDFGYLMFSRATLQNAVRTAARYAVTGNCGANGGAGSNCFVNGPQDRLNVILQTVTSYSFSVNPVTVSVQCVQGSCPGYAGQGSNNAGGPGDTVKVSATYTYHPSLLSRFFSGGAYTFTVSSSFKNEAFPPPS
jgi:Flp pilus assembly protein TadG